MHNADNGFKSDNSQMIRLSHRSQGFALQINPWMPEEREKTTMEISVRPPIPQSPRGMKSALFSTLHAVSPLQINRPCVTINIGISSFCRYGFKSIINPQPQGILVNRNSLGFSVRRHCATKGRRTARSCPVAPLCFGGYDGKYRKAGRVT